MDQTTDTADLDLTETEKYLNNVLVESGSGDESDGEVEEEAQDALLGGIRTGIRTITRTTREALSTCKNKIELDSAVADIENSTLKLLKLEKSFMKTATIVSGVIDDLVSDFDEENEGPNSSNEDVLTSSDSPIAFDTNGAGDATIAQAEKSEPYVFRLTPVNLNAVTKFREKLTNELHKRMDEYKSSLTDSHLKADKKFVALLDQVKLGRRDAESSANYGIEIKSDCECDEADGEMGANNRSSETDLASFLASIPYSAEELLKHKYQPYREENDMDDSVLPSVDPITKELIILPVKNKYCNHVFDRDSIFSYIACNPEARCPVHMCNNKQTLEECHFVTSSALTARIRRKNKL